MAIDTRQKRFSMFELGEIGLGSLFESDGTVDLDDVIFELGLYKKGSSTNIIDEMLWISKDDEEV